MFYKLFLMFFYIFIKIINKICIHIRKYCSLFITICIIISFFNLSIGLYILSLVMLLKIAFYFSNDINNVLSIDRLNSSINMNLSIDTKKLKGTNSIEKLNYLVNQFIDGLEKAALNPQKYNIKQNKKYKFRTHGAVYILFERNLRKRKMDTIAYEKSSVVKAILGAKEKKLGLKKVRLSDKLIFLVERMLVQTSIKEMLKYFSKVNFNKIQICNFEATFSNNGLYIKSLIDEN